MTLFEKSRTWLPGMTQAAAGVTVTYTRGATSVTLAAVVGQVAYRVDAEGGRRVELGDRDYLILASDLTFGTPRAGDRVTETIDGAAVTFEAQDTDTGEPCWRWSDPQRTEYRIHVKKVG